jgi:glycosyltransferase involved in cell wall biosynthesis
MTPPDHKSPAIADNADVAPCLSVIIPVFNEAATIRDLVRSVCAQRPVQEVVIVDDCSTDATAKLVELLAPLIANKADVVFGSRFAGGSATRVLYFWHSLGNRVLTLLSNMFTNLNMTDMETCYKVFRREIIQGVKIEENRFGFEPEIVAKIRRIKDVRIYEVSISYYGRTYADGKKISWRDGVRALWCIVKYNVLS